MFTKTVAVIGGTGFLGRHVTRALESAGYGVRALSRRSGFDALEPNPDALRGCDAVVNLAGIKREEGEQTFQSVHVDLVERLTSAMKKAGVRRLVHISVVVARPAPGLPYHDTKWKGEQAVRASDLDWTILRPGVIYGNGDDMLGHLTLMIRTAAIFPIVGQGAAPMRPVDACDVAAAVVASLEKPSIGKTYDVVGPERHTLRDVVGRVAEAMQLPLSIWSTPVWLMWLPVWLMEKTMKQPLSTTAQLAMLVEGLDGDPEPAKRELGLHTAPFTPERIRPLLASATRRFPFDLRLFSAERPPTETPAAPVFLILAILIVALTGVFGWVKDVWMGMTILSAVLLGILPFGPFRKAFPFAKRLKPSLFDVVAGCVAGLVLFGITRLLSAGLAAVWTGWDPAVRQLYSWQGDHSGLFLGPTLVLIILFEEVAWRGLVTQFFMERWGRVTGILVGALVYAVAHTAAMNPLLPLAAVGCGVFWGWLYAATRNNLTAALVSHVVWDVLWMFVFPAVGR